MAYAKGAESSLQRTVEKLAASAPKAFADKTLLAALVDYLMPTPYVLGSKKPKDIDYGKLNPAFTSFLTNTALVDAEPEAFTTVGLQFIPLLIGIKGYKLDVSAGPDQAVLSFTVPRIADRFKTTMDSLKETYLPYINGIKSYTAENLRNLFITVATENLIDYRYQKGGDQEESTTFSLLDLPATINPCDYYAHEQEGFVIDLGYYDNELSNFVFKLPDYPAVSYP